MKCIIQEQIKTSHQISYNLMIICLKNAFQKKKFLFNANVNTNLNFL